MKFSKKRTTKALIRLRGRAGWSAPVLLANPWRQVFSRRCPFRWKGKMKAQTRLHRSAGWSGPQQYTSNKDQVTCDETYTVKTPTGLHHWACLSELSPCWHPTNRKRQTQTHKCHYYSAGKCISLTLHPSGLAVDRRLIHMASRNCLSIRSAPNTFSSTAKVKSTGPCATPPKWELIGFSFLSRTSLKCSVILSRNSRSVSPTYTVQSHLEHVKLFDKRKVFLFDLILIFSSTIFQLNRDGSSWVEPY